MELETKVRNIIISLRDDMKREKKSINRIPISREYKEMIKKRIRERIRCLNVMYNTDEFSLTPREGYVEKHIYEFPPIVKSIFKKTGLHSIRKFGKVLETKVYLKNGEKYYMKEYGVYIMLYVTLLYLCSKEAN